jgi:hypothetical protein
MRLKTFFAFMAVLLAGCASIISGTDQKITFKSEPEGATVTVAGRVLGKTPLTVDVDKDKNLPLTFEKEGYKTYTTQLSTRVDGWFWGNIVIGGLLGSTTDGMSGGMYEYSPDQYYVTLVPVQSTPLSVSNNKLKVKELVVGFGSELRQQLVVGKGEQLNALLVAISRADGDSADSVNVLKKLATQHADDVELAESICNFYDVK